MRKPRMAALLLLPLGLAGQHTTPPAPSDFVRPFSVDSLPFTYTPFQPGHNLANPAPPRIFRNFQLISFGHYSSAVAPFDAPSLTNAKTAYDVLGLECPACGIAPPNRTRATLQPFGAKLSVDLFHGHLQLFASYGGNESWRPDGQMQGIGAQHLSPLGGINSWKAVAPNLAPMWGGAHLLWDGQYNDSWLLQTHLGFRYFLDSEKSISFGISQGYVQNTGPSGAPNWRSTTADLTITLPDHPVKSLKRRLRRSIRSGRQRIAHS